eukprot:1877142-Pleurochrysis_carterae.AAC.1
MPLNRALKKLGLRWAPLDADGDDSASPQSSDDDGEEATVDEEWLLRSEGEQEEAQWSRAGVLRAAG